MKEKKDFVENTIGIIIPCYFSSQKTSQIVLFKDNILKDVIFVKKCYFENLDNTPGSR